MIESWREAGVPLEAVIRGIDNAFDNHDKQRLRAGNHRQRKVNGLAWCAQSVLEAVEQSREASIGMSSDAAPNAREDAASGFEAARIARYLERNAAALLRASAILPQPARTAAAETADRLIELATPLQSPRSADSSSSRSEDSASSLNLESLDRTLTVLEEKLFAALLTATPEDELVALREQAARELAPYRGKMQAVQIKQVQQQFLQKRLLEAHTLPRLSLFYMPHEDDAEAEAE